MFNSNSGYGRSLLNLLPLGVPGKLFIVGKAALAHYDMYSQVFGVDAAGVTRFFATIDQAVGVCTANAGDVIAVLPGHTETISSATALLLDVAGITIVGLGNGNDRPTLTYDTATTATIPVSAANIKLKNFILSANFADIVAAFTLTTAKNFTIEDCVVKATATNMNFKYVFDTNATTADADGLTVKRCSWIEPDAATISMCKVDGTNDSWVFEDNYVSIATQATGGGLFVIATGKVLTNVRVLKNKLRLIGGDLSGAGVVFTTDGSTNSGFFDGNVVQHTDTAAEIFGTASSGFSFGLNYMSGVAGASGYLLPAADS